MFIASTVLTSYIFESVIYNNALYKTVKAA